MLLQTIEGIKNIIGHNQFLAGGTLIGVFAGAFATIKTIPNRIYQFSKNKIITSVEITEDSQDCKEITKDLEDKVKKIEEIEVLV